MCQTQALFQHTGATKSVGIWFCFYLSRSTDTCVKKLWFYIFTQVKIKSGGNLPSGVFPKHIHEKLNLLQAILCQVNWTRTFHIIIIIKTILLKGKVNFISTEILILVKSQSLNICYIEHKQRKTKENKNISSTFLHWWFCFPTQKHEIAQSGLLNRNRGWRKSKMGYNWCSVRNKKHLETSLTHFCCELQQILCTSCDETSCAAAPCGFS